MKTRAAATVRKLTREAGFVHCRSPALANALALSSAEMMADPETAPPRRREMRKAERRAAIVGLATRLFLESGYARTTMSGIAAELGGSKGTLWNHFASKEELFAAVLDTATADFRSVMTPVLDQGLAVEEALASFAEKFITRISMPDAISLQRLIIGEVERFPEIGRIFYDRAPNRSRAMLAAFLAEHMDAGSLSWDDPGEAASTFLSMCAGYPQRLLWGVEEQDETEIRREALRIAKNFARCYRPE